MTRRPDRVLAARLALVAALVAGLATGCGGDGFPVAAPPAPSPTVTSTTSTPIPATPTPTGTRSSSPRPTPPAGAATTAPSDIGFVDTELYELPGRIRLPRSPSAGPARLQNNLASGFAHTPLGAVVAGINIGGRADRVVGEAIYRPTIERQVIGDGQADLLRRVHRSSRPEATASSTPAGETAGAAGGFTLESYTPTEATISYLMIVSRSGQTRYAAYRLTVRWADGDWKLVAPPNGDFRTAISVPSSIDGFHPFTTRGITA